MACALFWRAALGLLCLCNCELNSHAPIDRVGEDYGNVERWSMESCPPFPPATSHEASAPHLSPNSILRFAISCHSFLPGFYPQNGLLSEKPQSTASSNKLDGKGVVGYFCYLQNPLFLFFNCYVPKNGFKNHDWNVFHETRRRKNIRWRK